MTPGHRRRRRALLAAQHTGHVQVTVLRHCGGEVRGQVRSLSSGTAGGEVRGQVRSLSSGTAGGEVRGQVRSLSSGTAGGGQRSGQVTVLRHCGGGESRLEVRSGQVTVGGETTGQCPPALWGRGRSTVRSGQVTPQAMWRRGQRVGQRSGQVGLSHCSQCSTLQHFMSGH